MIANSILDLFETVKFQKFGVCELPRGITHGRDQSNSRPYSLNPSGSAETHLGGDYICVPRADSPTGYHNLCDVFFLLGLAASNGSLNLEDATDVITPEGSDYNYSPLTKHEVPKTWWNNRFPDGGVRAIIINRQTDWLVRVFDGKSEGFAVLDDRCLGLLKL